jgi:AraC family transcriptional regulator, arabinose operon regulatory protein
MDCVVNRLHYPATMPAKKDITPIIALRPEGILADAYVRGPDYTNWRPKGSGDWLLILTVDGAGRIQVGAREHRLGRGQAVLFAPGAEQDYATEPAAGRWELAWAHFQPRAHWRAWLAWPQIARGVGVLALEPVELGQAMETALRRASALSRRSLAGAGDLAMNALEEALLWADEARAGSQWARVDARVRRAMDFLGAQVDEAFSMARLARHCGLSESRLAHLFTRETGTSPQRFAEEVKLERARQLLRRTTSTVGEVAAACGYADAFYFARRFAKATGQSPSAWRTSQGGG